MLTKERREYLEYLKKLCPIDLGDDHRVGWKEDGDLWYVHTCQFGPQLGWIDVMSGEHHKIIERDPLHIEASVACRGCPDHGWIRGGRWVVA